MICPICGCATTVLQTWNSERHGYKRRRECLDCGHRYTTVETIVEKPKEEERAKPDEDREPAVLKRTPTPKCVRSWGLSDLHIAMRAGKTVAAADGDAGA